MEFQSMFMRYWRDCRPVVNHGRLWDWIIFTKRVRDLPDKETGAVMFHINYYSHALIPDELSTEPAAHPGEAEFLYVLEGRGFVESRGEKREVRDGSSVQIPAGAEHIIVNSAPCPMEMLTMRRAPLDDGSEDKLVVRNWREPRDEASRKASPEGSMAHWYHLHKGPFVGVHGFHSGCIPPRKIPDPHGHSPGTDELWYVAKGGGWHWVGQGIEWQGTGYALWVQPETTHSLINVSDEMLEYIYCSYSPRR